MGIYAKKNLSSQDFPIVIQEEGNDETPIQLILNQNHLARQNKQHINEIIELLMRVLSNRGIEAHFTEQEGAPHPTYDILAQKGNTVVAHRELHSAITEALDRLKSNLGRYPDISTAIQETKQDMQTVDGDKSFLPLPGLTTRNNYIDVVMAEESVLYDEIMQAIKVKLSDLPGISSAFAQGKDQLAKAVVTAVLKPFHGTDAGHEGILSEKFSVQVDDPITSRILPALKAYYGDSCNAAVINYQAGELADAVHDVIRQKQEALHPAASQQR